MDVGLTSNNAKMMVHKKAVDVHGGSKRRSKSMHLPSGQGLERLRDLGDFDPFTSSRRRAKAGPARVFEFEDAPSSSRDRPRARGAAVYDLKLDMKRREEMLSSSSASSSSTSTSAPPHKAPSSSSPSSSTSPSSTRPAQSSGLRREGGHEDGHDQQETITVPKGGRPSPSSPSTSSATAQTTPSSSSPYSSPTHLQSRTPGSYSATVPSASTTSSSGPTKASSPSSSSTRDASLINDLIPKLNHSAPPAWWDTTYAYSVEGPHLAGPPEKSHHRHLPLHDRHFQNLQKENEGNRHHWHQEEEEGRDEVEEEEEEGGEEGEEDMSWQNGGLAPSLVRSFPGPPGVQAANAPNKRNSIVFRNPPERAATPSSSPLASSSSASSSSSSPSPPSTGRAPLSSSTSSLPPIPSLSHSSSFSPPTSSPLSSSSSSLPTVSALKKAAPPPAAIDLDAAASSTSSSATRRQPSHRQLLLLNIYCPDRDVGIRLQFTPSSTVEEALEQTVRRLFAHLPPPPPQPAAASSSLASGASGGASGASSTEQASLEETMKKPWKFMCLGTGDGSGAFYLYRDRTLASYNLRDEDELDLVLPEGPPRLVKITIRDNQSTFTQRVEEETTVWEVVHKITRKIADAAVYPLDEYGLFTAEGQCLREDEALSAHVPNAATKLEFRRMALPLKDLQQFHLKIINTCEVVASKPGSQQAPTELTLGFNRNATVKDALRRALKLFPIKDRFSAAFYNPALRTWMRPDANLVDLQLEDNTVVELRSLYKAYSLTVPVGKERVKDVYKFRAEDTVQDLYDLLLFNNPQISEAKEKYVLCTRGGVQLDPNRPIWTYDSTFEVRVKLQPVAVLIMGREEVVDVDFSAPVEKVIESICRRFHIDETQKDRLTLHSPSSPAALNTRSSLSEQNVPPSCALIVKMATPPAAAATTGGLGAKGSQVKSPPKGTKSEDSEGGLTVGDVKISLEQLPSNLAIGKEDTGTYGENTNIWTEPDGPQYSNQETTPEGEVILHSGTLNKLVVHLTAAHSTDVRFMHAFLMTYLSFTNPRTLLNKLIERYHVPATTHSASEVKRIQLRVCNVLKHWVSNHFDDFDHDLIQTVVNFVDESLAVDGHDSITTVLRNAIVKRTCGLKSRVTRGRQMTALPSRAGASPAPKLEIKNDKWRRSVRLGIDLPDVAMSIFDYDEEEVARQLTIREFLLYREIKSSELLNQAWNKEKLHYKAFNVLEMIRKFNEVSMWVVSLILEPIKVKHRAKRLEFLIKTASHLLQLNNFNLLMSFVSGMNNSCILRLKYTKALLSKKAAETLERLEKLMSPEGSYKEYREALATVNPPCIPYIGVHLSDLVFIEDGNPDEVNGLINWDKRALVHKVIDLLGQYQNSVYNLTYVGAISHFLEDMSAPSEKELFEISLQREPRGAQKNQII